MSKATATHETATAFAQRSAEKILFNHKDMDYYLGWMLLCRCWMSRSAASMKL